MLTDGELPSNYLLYSVWRESRAGFTYRLSKLKPRATRSKGLQLTVVGIEPFAGIRSVR